jgi:hypothetical protein
MTMLPARLVCVLALAAGVALGVGCGSDGGTIASGDARGLRDDLDRVRESIDAGKCDQAQSEVAVVRRRVEQLDVPQRLRRNFATGVAKLGTAAGRDCEDAPTQTVAPPPPPPPAQTTETNTETTAPPETATTEPPTTLPPETQTTEPPTGGAPPEPDQNGGNGGDGGDGGQP